MTPMRPLSRYKGLATRPTPLFENRPPRPWGWARHPPEIVNMPTFTEAHRRVDDALKNYIEYPKSNYLMPSMSVLDELPWDAARHLYSNSMEARIAFAETALRHARSYPGLQDVPIFHVVITPAAFAREVGDEGFADR